MQHTAGPLGNDGQQVHRPLKAVPGAAQRLAVQRGRSEIIRPRLLSQHVADPAGQNLLEGDNVDPRQHLPQTAGRRGLAKKAQQMPEVNRFFVQPLGDRVIAATVLQNSAHDGRQNSREDMASSLTPSWIRNLRQILAQVPPRGSEHEQGLRERNLGLRTLTAILPHGSIPFWEEP